MCPGGDLPERFGPWQTVTGRFARWAADGTFDRLPAAARIDATIVRAHQHTAAKWGSMNGPPDAPAAG
ncbi:transposase [Streptomyces sp. NPDC001549]|uniref:transposase n=1 Tax=Streptomyces sp. NPDC001549 TaxID=3364586 RepID=UPI0036799681